MSLRQLLHYRKSIYGICTIWVVFFHIFIRIGLPYDIPVISGIISYGNIAVDIFLFFSGVCVWMAYDKNHNLKVFFIKRIKRVVVPYLVISTPFWLWRTGIAQVSSKHSILLCFLGDISSGSFWLKGTQTTWFVFAICIFYLLIPVLYNIFAGGDKRIIILLVLIYLLNIIGMITIPLYRNSSIAWTRLPIFVIGCAAGKHIDQLDFSLVHKKKKQIIFAGSLSLLVIFLLCFPTMSDFQALNFPSEVLWMLYGIVTICIIAIMIILSSRFGLVANRAFDFIGEMSLEIYMIHVFVLRLFDYYELTDRFSYMNYPFVLAISIICSCIISKFIAMLNKFIK